DELSVTELLEAHRLGTDGALDRAFAIVYQELRRLARYQLRGRGGNTLNTTMLVHELYLKFAAGNQSGPENRSHLLSIASRAMRHIIVDSARARATSKRGGGMLKVSLDSNEIAVDDQAEWILSVDQALEQIRGVDERLERVFECRYFAGLTDEESAVALGVSVSTVQRDWRRAKAWLREALAGGE
ncbi:MAG: sigma-70 family RNA polymerase sigma factor, partial [Rhodothermales bacterium]|nr:sigma-70 family RNA polymerase sigma factor [Rhodothermales bacterium]